MHKKVLFDGKHTLHYSCHDIALKEDGYDLQKFNINDEQSKAEVFAKRRLSLKQELQKRREQIKKSQKSLTVEEFTLKCKKQLPSLKYPVCMYEEIMKSSQVKDTLKIISYLYLVRENPQEHITLQKQLNQSVGKPLREITGIGKAFCDRNRTGEKSELENLVQKAAYELGHSTLHPVCARYKDVEKEQEKALQKGLALIKTKHGAARNRPLDIKSLVFEDNMTPLERARAEAELMAKELTTAQLIKAREVALIIMGENSRSITHWWVANKECRYLRGKGSMNY